MSGQKQELDSSVAEQQRRLALLVQRQRAIKAQRLLQSKSSHASLSSSTSAPAAASIPVVAQPSTTAVKRLAARKSASYSFSNEDAAELASNPRMVKPKRGRVARWSTGGRVPHRSHTDESATGTVVPSQTSGAQEDAQDDTEDDDTAADPATTSKPVARSSLPSFSTSYAQRLVAAATVTTPAPRASSSVNISPAAKISSTQFFNEVAAGQPPSAAMSPVAPTTVQVRASPGSEEDVGAPRSSQCKSTKGRRRRWACLLDHIVWY